MLLLCLSIHPPFGDDHPRVLYAKSKVFFLQKPFMKIQKFKNKSKRLERICNSQSVGLNTMDDDGPANPLCPPLWPAIIVFSPTLACLLSTTISVRFARFSVWIFINKQQQQQIGKHSRTGI